MRQEPVIESLLGGATDTPLITLSNASQVQKIRLYLTPRIASNIHISYATEESGDFVLLGSAVCEEGFITVNMSSINSPISTIQLKFATKNTRIHQYDIVVPLSSEHLSAMSKKERAMESDTLMGPLYDKLRDIMQFMQWCEDDTAAHQHLNDMLTYHQSLLRTLQILHTQKLKCIKMEEYKHANRIKNQIAAMTAENAHIWGENMTSGVSPGPETAPQKQKNAQEHHDMHERQNDTPSTARRKRPRDSSRRHEKQEHERKLHSTPSSPRSQFSEMHHHHLAHHFLPPSGTARTPYFESHPLHVQTLASSQHRRISTSNGELSRPYDPAAMYHTTPYLPPMTNHFPAPSYPPTMPTFPSTGSPYNPAMRSPGNSPYPGAGFVPSFADYMPYAPPRSHFGPPNTSDGSTVSQYHHMHTPYHLPSYAASPQMYHVSYNSSDAPNRINTASSFHTPNHKASWREPHHMTQLPPPNASHFPQQHMHLRRQTIAAPSEYASHPPQMISITESASTDMTPYSVHNDSTTKSTSSYQKSPSHYTTPLSSTKPSMYKDSLIRTTPQNDSSSLRYFQDHYAQSPHAPYSPTQELIKNKKIGQIVHSDGEYSRYQSNLQRIRDAAKRILQEKAQQAQKPSFTKVLLDRTRLNEMLKKQKEIDKEKIEKLKNDTKEQQQLSIQQITLTSPHSIVNTPKMKTSLKTSKRGDSGKSAGSIKSERSHSRMSADEREKRKQHRSSSVQRSQDNSLKESTTEPPRSPSTKSNHSNKSNRSAKTSITPHHPGNIQHRSTKKDVEKRKNVSPTVEQKEEKVASRRQPSGPDKRRSTTKKSTIPVDAETFVPSTKTETEAAKSAVNDSSEEAAARAQLAKNNARKQKLRAKQTTQAEAIENESTTLANVEQKAKVELPAQREAPAAQKIPRTEDQPGETNNASAPSHLKTPKVHRHKARPEKVITESETSASLKPKGEEKQTRLEAAPVAAPTKSDVTVSITDAPQTASSNSVDIASQEPPKSVAARSSKPKSQNSVPSSTADTSPKPQDTDASKTEVAPSESDMPKEISASSVAKTTPATKPNPARKREPVSAANTIAKRAPAQRPVAKRPSDHANAPQTNVTLNQQDDKESKGSASSADVASESGGGASTNQSRQRPAPAQTYPSATVESGLVSTPTKETRATASSSAQPSQTTTPNKTHQLSKVDAARRKRLLEKQKQQAGRGEKATSEGNTLVKLPPATKPGAPSAPKRRIPLHKR